jgi:hypothetical protein
MGIYFIIFMDKEIFGNRMSPGRPTLQPDLWRVALPWLIYSNHNNNSLAMVLVIKIVICFTISYL